jgi:hypothetical protein
VSVLANIGVFRQMLIKISNMKFHADPHGGCRRDACGLTDIQTGRQEADNRFSDAIASKSENYVLQK